MIDMIELLKKAMEEYPELRLCQLLNIVAFKGGWKSDDLFYCQDSIIENGLKIFLEKSKKLTE